MNAPLVCQKQHYECHASKYEDLCPYNMQSVDPVFYFLIPADFISVAFLIPQLLEEDIETCLSVNDTLKIFSIIFDILEY